MKIRPYALDTTTLTLIGQDNLSGIDYYQVHLDGSGWLTIDRVITYGYDDLYRLTSAGYLTGELYEYEYDPVGNRLRQIINGDTTDYLYDAANRLEQVAVSELHL